MLSQTAPGYDSPMLVDGQLTEAAKETQVWYTVANNLAGTMSDELGIRPETAAALLAIFSAGMIGEITLRSLSMLLKFGSKTMSLTTLPLRR